MFWVSFLQTHFVQSCRMEEEWSPETESHQWSCHRHSLQTGKTNVLFEIPEQWFRALQGSLRGLRSHREIPIWLAVRGKSHDWSAVVCSLPNGLGLPPVQLPGDHRHNTKTRFNGMITTSPRNGPQALILLLLYLFQIETLHHNDRNHLLDTFKGFHGLTGFIPVGLESNRKAAKSLFKVLFQNENTPCLTMQPLKMDFQKHQTLSGSSGRQERDLTTRTARAYACIPEPKLDSECQRNTQCSETEWEGC